jgi:hypothetical protein
MHRPVSVYMFMYLYVLSFQRSCIPCISACMFSHSTEIHADTVMYALLEGVCICVYLKGFWSWMHPHMHIQRSAYMPVSDCILILHTGTYAISIVCISVRFWLYFLIQYMQILHQFCAFYCAELAASRLIKKSVRRCTGWAGKHEGRALRCAGPDWSLRVLEESVLRT